MATKPWIHGPLELLNHGLEHLSLGSDFDVRIAMISIDNSVELIIKTYLGLPSRVTGISGLSRKRYDELVQSFPSLLDGLEEFATDKIVGLELGDIEWFHRLRNQLYHEGNGITVERSKVEGYAEIARILFFNLFGVKHEDVGEKAPHSLVGQFFSGWAQMERELLRLQEKHSLLKEGKFVPPSALAEFLVQGGLMTKSLLDEFNVVRQFRNKLAHGFEAPSVQELEKYNSSLKSLLQTLSKL